MSVGINNNLIIKKIKKENGNKKILPNNLYEKKNFAINIYNI